MKLKINRSIIALWIILALTFLVTGLVDSYFFSIPSIGITLQLAAPLGLLAAGQTIVMLTGGIDLSLAMIATGAAYIVSVKSESGLFISLAYALIFCVVVGAVNGIAVGVFGVNPLIMTLSMSAILIGVFTVGVSTFLRGSSRMPDLLITASSGLILDPITWPLIIWIIVGGFVHFSLTRTGFGRVIYAIGDNAKAARLAGVKVWQVQIAAYVSCAILGGMAGIMLGGQSGAVAISLANSYLLPSVAAVVIGGTSIMGGVGSYSGSVMGALILSVLSYLLATLNSSEAFKQLVYGGIVLALAWVYSSISERK
ncbi:MAG: ABC transporter permease [Actinobacteria bacterium]|nr:ABC transporter permease [Actinomycetota bacterium]